MSCSVKNPSIWSKNVLSGRKIVFLLDFFSEMGMPLPLKMIQNLKTSLTSWARGKWSPTKLWKSWKNIKIDLNHDEKAPFWLIFSRRGSPCIDKAFQSNPEPGDPIVGQIKKSYTKQITCTLFFQGQISENGFFRAGFFSGPKAHGRRPWALGPWPKAMGLWPMAEGHGPLARGRCDKIHYNTCKSNIGRPKRLIGSFIGRKYTEFLDFVRFGPFWSFLVIFGLPRPREGFKTLN